MSGDYIIIISYNDIEIARLIENNNILFLDRSYRDVLGQYSNKEVGSKGSSKGK